MAICYTKKKGDNKEFTLVMGRRWEEFVDMMNFLKEEMQLNATRRLAIYSHGLFFEFQHIRNFVEVEGVFARKKREPMKVDINEAFELRCSFYLSNMSLKKFISNTPNAIYNKLSGDDYNYRIIRTAETKLKQYELDYQANDVLGLCECIVNLLKEDTIASIPLTSTGFVRREVRSKVLKNPENQMQMKAIALTPHQYVLCKTASRGGNSAVNTYLANQILSNVKAKDRKSSYPAEMMASKYPMSKFMKINPDIDTFEEYRQKGKALLIDVTFWNLKLKNRMTIPYIPLAKCTNLCGNKAQQGKDIIISNGRIIEAKCASMVITDIDYKIIENTYTFEPEFESIHFANYNYLNKEFRLSLLEMFRQKTILERGDEYLYNKIKNKINAYFGMMLTDICSPEIFYRKGKWDKEKELDLDSKLSNYYNKYNSFLSYQHGVWVTAHARYSLQESIDIVGIDTIMVDTDSNKHLGDHEEDFDILNARWLRKCMALEIPPVVKVWEKPTIMGKWETEKECDKYKTLGAKKHAYIYKGDTATHITVAGLNKEKGADYITKNGGLDYFKIGNDIPVGCSGRTVAYYHDVDAPYYITVDGCTMLTGSSIGVVDASYTIGLSDDYWRYLLSLNDDDLLDIADFNNIKKAYLKEIEYEKSCKSE